MHWTEHLPGDVRSLSILPSFTYILCNNFEIVSWDNVLLRCHCHLGDVYLERRAEGTACSYGTYTLVSSQRQAIVNTLTSYQSTRTKGAHILERLVISRIGDEQVKTMQSTPTARWNGGWRQRVSENTIIRRMRKLTKAIGVDLGSGVNCGCWWLVVELQKWKVNKLVIQVTWQRVA